MDQTLKEFEEPIVAIACQDKEGDFHFLYPEKPFKLRDLDFQDELLRVNDFFILYEWFSSVVICTKETLEELLQELKESSNPS